MYIITEYQLQQLMNSYVHMNRKDVFDEIKRQQVNPDGGYAVLADVRADMLIRAMNLLKNYRPDKEGWIENYYELEAEVSEHFS